MNIMRTIAVLTIFTIVGALSALTAGNPTYSTLGFFVSNAQAVDLEKALPNEVFQNVRASKVYVNPPELPRFGYSNAVVVNSWTRPLVMDPVYGTDGTSRSLTAHIKSALDQMEQEMLAKNVTKEALLALDVFYEVTGNSFDKMVAISSVLNEYSASRMAYATNPHSLNALPVRNIYGVTNVPRHLGGNVPGAKVALVATVLDPETTTDSRLFDIKSAPARKDGRASFIVGGLAAQSMDFTTSSDKQPQAVLNNLDIVLAAMGTDKGAIETLKVNYASRSGLTESNLRPVLEEYFAPSGIFPEIEWNEVEIAGFVANDVCVEAHGSLILEP